MFALQVAHIPHIRLLPLSPSYVLFLATRKLKILIQEVTISIIWEKSPGLLTFLEWSQEEGKDRELWIGSRWDAAVPEALVSCFNPSIFTFTFVTGLSWKKGYNMKPPCDDFLTPVQKSEGKTGSGDSSSGLERSPRVWTLSLLTLGIQWGDQMSELPYSQNRPDNIFFVLPHKVFNCSNETCM